MEKLSHTLLCIDDEPNILKALQRLFRKEPFNILTANSGEAGLKILAEHQVHVVVSDQRMPGMNGTEFLKQVKEVYPDVIRILLTGYTDVDSISEAINEGHLYKFFLKPWNDQNLKLEIRQAMAQYDLVQDNRRLHNQVLAQNEELKKINENLESTILERTRNLEFQNRALQISHAILDDLPVPILGVSAEKMIVMVNREYYRHWGTIRPINLGGNVRELFGAGFSIHLDKCLADLEKLRVSAKNVDGETIEMQLIPLTGRYKGQGVIIRLLASEQPYRQIGGK